MKSPEVFAYVSACCNVRAEKPALVKIAKSKKSSGPDIGLGHWTCTGCGKSCKAHRHVVKEKNNATS